MKEYKICINHRVNLFEAELNKAVEEGWTVIEDTYKVVQDGYITFSILLYRVKND